MADQQNLLLVTKVTILSRKKALQMLGKMNETVKKYYRPEILKQACAEFAIKFDNVKLIKGNSNLIFDCGNRILRLSHSDIRSYSDVEAEINWLLFLIEKKLPVVNIIPSKSKQAIIQLGEADNHFTVVCFEKILGNKLSKAAWKPSHFERLGQLCGLLHQVGNQFPQNTATTYKDWDQIIEFDSYKYLPQDDRELPQLHHQVVGQINQLPKTKNNYGLIHYDIHHGNYLLTKQNTELVLFDFEMTCKSWFINDVATLLYYAGHVPKTIADDAFESEFMQHFWRGYEREYHIEDFEKNWIPHFLLYRDLMLYGFLSNLWKAKTLSKQETQYLDNIQASIKRRRKKRKYD